MRPKNSIYVEKSIRQKMHIKQGDLDRQGRMEIPDFKTSRSVVSRIHKALEKEAAFSASDLYLMSLLNQLYQELIEKYFRPSQGSASADIDLSGITESREGRDWEEYLESLATHFPISVAAEGKPGSLAFLKKHNALSGRVLDGILLHLVNRNPACSPMTILFPDTELSLPLRDVILSELEKLTDQSVNGPDRPFDLVSLLLEPAKRFPDSLEKQIQYILDHWGTFLQLDMTRLLNALDFFKEEHQCRTGGPGPVEGIDFSLSEGDYANFSQDSDWMPNTILLAKNAFVWLDQLSKKYNRTIQNLREIPDEELNELGDRGITGLWLIGLWERSKASKTIKRICGNPEAEASAYSLNKYDIADVLGGWDALENLKSRCLQRGIRMASDMVPNHTGLDSDWVIEHPEYFLSRKDLAFPSYTFNGPDLSQDGRIGLFLEDGYYSRSDASVVFKRVDNSSGEVLYMYHGNDGTTMPWNDTAQLNFLEPSIREEVIQQILHVARHFPIIRFDAAMTLARKHIQRLWFPEPGRGGAIPSRSEFSMSDTELRKKIPVEFWREVVDRIALEMPDTLLLAEAFWMMEGYFVRNLGMHRVYNSAFMNLLKMEDNREFRRLLKETLDYDPKIMKRFVNFMNNPDEDTAVAQFGKGDKYFGVCTLMMTLPGLPMIGHGQFEGYEEKYGMEYKKAYRDESVDQALLDRHYREIVPLMKKRILFAGAKEFHLFDFLDGYRQVNENVYAFANAREGRNVIVLYNNSHHQTSGLIQTEVPKAVNNSSGEKAGTQSRHIQEILHLREGEFLLLFDEKESLWYIHRSSEIVRNGLPVNLMGYQSRVYFPIIQRQDDEKRCLEKLIRRVGTDGFPHLEHALKFSELEPVIHMLREFFQTGIIDTPEMADMVTMLSEDMNQIRKILPKKSSLPHKGGSETGKRVGAMIIPAVQALKLTDLNDSLLFHMARFYEICQDRSADTEGRNFRALLIQLLEDPEFHEWFGINEYEQILWFNQEKMQEALWWFTVVGAVGFLHSGEDSRVPEELDRYEQFLTDLQNALGESEYQVRSMIRILSSRSL